MSTYPYEYYVEIVTKRYFDGVDHCNLQQVHDCFHESVVLTEGFFVILCGFQNRTRGAYNQVSHGHERIRVAISPSSGTRSLEQSVKALQPGIGIG